ncbi:TonB-dependent receptor [Pedobacter sp. MC2016-14]|uniref:SusC/RagA family TonB-linked outer membrane protein n=1 Tax=Pedobacter sp. MC2016-14 TaxID=2897327 RepID=UPI001E642E38|nr:TonB-dependent receptor [Pedobacter sp. MC2016-14]MCD0488965.1 TonB-dependent receptor [Pedobacter sp. MC2016-14]
MKLNVVLIMIVFLQANAASFAQKVNLKVENATIKTVFNKLTEQTGQTFMADGSLIKNLKPISLNVTRMELKEVLHRCFEGQNIELVFNATYKTVVIRKIDEPQVPANNIINVTGKVTDEQRQAMAGVNITVKGTKITAKSNINGIYKIVIPDQSNPVLQFTFVGYEPLEMPVAGKSVLNVSLKLQNTGLNEVYVIGYGTTTRKDLTGSVAKVNIKDLALAPVKSFDDALAGRVAGVEVTTNDGQPGAPSNIVIRGANSVTQDNSPLYVIDGFPVTNPDNNLINSADIESIDILKDASATAIYGSRGANGVIIITTKRGKVGEPVLNYDGYYGLQKDVNRPKMMEPYDFVRYQIANTPATAINTYLTIPNRTLDSYIGVAGLDLQDELLNTAGMQSHNLSVRGGSDKTQYSLSFGYLDQNGMMTNSGFSRYQGRLVLDQTVNDRFKIGINTNFSNTRTFGNIVNGGANSASINLLFQALGYRPTSGGANDEDLLNSLYDPTIDGNLNGDYRINPVLSARNELNRRTGNNLISNAYLQYKILPSLTLKVTGGMDLNFLKAEGFYNSQTSTGNIRYNSKGVNGSVTNTTNSNWLNENTLTYTKVFNKIHNLNAVAGFTAQKFNTSAYGLVASQIPNESLGIDGLDEGATQSLNSTSSRSTLLSFLGRVNYTYRSRYIFTLSMRRDGSSKFAPGHKWGAFPSGAFAWRLKQESFLKNIQSISDAKLRLSYGKTGNNRVSDFPYLTTVNLPIISYYNFNNGTPVAGVNLNAVGNEDLKWETTAQTDIGFDLSLFKERLSMTVDVYRKVTSDLLLNATLPYHLGYDTGFKNIGKMKNEGLEITLNTVNVKSTDFQWNSSFNISFNRNRVLGLTENQKVFPSTVAWDASFANALYVAKVGEPVAQFYGAIWDGVYQYEDFDKFPDGRYLLKSNLTTNGNPRANILPGDIKYKDINGDLVVDAKDFTIIGRAMPIHRGGFSNNFVYKKFGLNVFFQWSYGSEIFNANKLIFEGNGRGVGALNQYASYASYWTPEQPSSTLFRPNGQGPTYYSTRLLEDGSYLKLKTVSLNYNFSNDWLSKLKIKGLKAYITAQNLYTWTGYSGRDPDVSTRNSALTPGFDWSSYPTPRTIVIGLNANL